MDGRLLDADIRDRLRRRLLDDNAARTDILILPEFSVWAATIGDTIVGYEIKSDADALRRLPLQADICGHVCDRLNLETTERHLAKAMALLPGHWGVTLHGEGSSERVRSADDVTLGDAAMPTFVASQELADSAFRNEPAPGGGTSYDR